MPIFFIIVFLIFPYIAHSTSGSPQDKNLIWINRSANATSYAQEEDSYTIDAKWQEVTCPSTPDWCFGTEPETKPNVTDPIYNPGYVYTWSYRTTARGSWTAAGTGNTPSSMPWTTIIAGSYEMKMVQSFGTEVVKICDQDYFTIFPIPTGELTIT
jgi:hypothetical protein